ncbi:MAG: protein-export chaperone SecB [Alphaproteobacteria bacterium]|nr:protein-export chaperone SecB [Alphaproteobacteria bacterium]
MNGNGANGVTDTQPRVTVGVQYLKDLSFESPNAPMSFNEMETRPEIGIDLNVEARPLQENHFEVVLHVTARAKRSETVLFLVELSYGAVVSVPPLPDEFRSRVIGSEVPKLLFPFARSIIANAVRDGGFPPFLIDPIDFDALFERAAAAQADEQKQEADGQPMREEGGAD